MKKGLPRMEAYDLVQRISLKVIEGKSDFKREVYNHKEMRKYFSQEELDQMFTPHQYLKNIDVIYKRMGLDK